MDGGGSGQIVVRGNFGTANSVELPMGSISVNQSSSPLTFSQTQVADGDSAVLPFVVYDSLGKPINVRMTAYVETITPTSTTFRYLLESNADSDLDIAVGNSTITFDSDGRVTSTPDNAFAIDRDDSAADQLLFDMQFDELFNLDGNESVLQLEFQNGTPPGTLTDYVIDEQGLINGIFDNGLVRSLGQLVMSRFDNPNGLIQSGPGTFTEGVNSGLARIGTPGSVNMGTVRAGAVELSNTDIGQSMVDLIRSSTNYRGNARVISSVQNLIDELLLLGR